MAALFLVCSPRQKGLEDLLAICQTEARALELVISLKKSMVISSSHNSWVVHDAQNNVYACFDKICSYKYLGITTYNTMFKTATAKQIKTVMAGRKYRGADISRGGGRTLWTWPAAPGTTWPLGRVKNIL